MTVRLKPTDVLGHRTPPAYTLLRQEKGFRSTLYLNLGVLDYTLGPKALSSPCGLLSGKHGL